MNLSKLNRTLTFCEAEIKNEFWEAFNAILTLTFRLRCAFSKTTVFESDSGDAKIFDFRKVVTYRGAAIRLSMMICLMRLGRHNGA
jgi:hypothetical protein